MSKTAKTLASIGLASGRESLATAFGGRRRHRSIVPAFDGPFADNCFVAIVVVLVVTTFLLSPGRAFAQTFEVVHHFGSPGRVTGFTGLVQARDLEQPSNPTFYGTATGGGLYGGGIAYRMDVSGNLVVLHDFNPSDDRAPSSPLVQADDGFFYGTTKDGGEHGLGSVMRMDSSGNVETVYSFDGTAGARPYASLIQATDHDLYGTTHGGGINGKGTVFRMTLSGDIVWVHSFSGPDGSYPEASLLQARDGDFYGTTVGVNFEMARPYVFEERSWGWGTIFRIDASGNITTLVIFMSGLPDLYFWGEMGSAPRSALIEASDNNFYGVTYCGPMGPNDSMAEEGLGFRMDSTGALTPVGFIFYSSLGALEAVDGNVYVTTSGRIPSNGRFWGSVMRFDPSPEPDSGMRGERLHYFQTDSPEGTPTSALVQGSDGDLYGTTDNAVYRMDTSGNVTFLVSGLHIWGPEEPESALLEVPTPEGGARFYGVSNLGGWGVNPSGSAYGAVGTLYEMDSSGNVTTLHSFNSDDGVCPYPWGGLVRGPDGFLYGITYGDWRCPGSLFRADLSGNVTLLHALDWATDGNSAEAPPILGSDGFIYGTTVSGGGEGCSGVAYRTDTLGNFTPLHAFCGMEGTTPTGLVQAEDGYFYGATAYGGNYGLGTVFRMDASGEMVVLHSFSGADGSNPATTSTPIQASDGLLYGLTEHGGEWGQGTIYSIDTAGHLTTLHSFGKGAGVDPTGALLEASDGFLYGVTRYSLSSGTRGTVFRVSTSGDLTELHTFTSEEGDDLYTGTMIQASDGHLYGTAAYGGAYGGGVVFRITLPNTVPVVEAGPDVNPAAGSAVSLNASFTDSDLGDAWTATIAWGDGVVEAGSVSKSGPSGTVTGSHAYALPGLYTVTVTVRDAREGVGSDSLTATVFDPCVPVLDVAFPPSIDPLAFVDGYVVQLNGGASVNPVCPGLAGVHFTWGDGTESDGGFPVSHHYQAHGSYTVTVTALAAGGQTSTRSGTVTIEETPGGTEPGAEVPVTPVDPTTGDTPAVITFEQVTSAGVTTVTSTESSPPPPSGFLLGGTTFDIATTATFSGPVSACISYAGLDVQETGLRLLHFVKENGLLANGTPCTATEGCWEDITDPDDPPEHPNPDTANDVICGTARSFSLFTLVAPVEIVIPLDPRPVQTAVVATVPLPSPVAADAAEWRWGDGITESDTPADGKVSATHTYAIPGTYTVELRLLKDGQEAGSAHFQYVVVYDPDGGFVTGGGWINSPAGAYPADPALVGKASFGFVSKYEPGKTVPSGNTQFQFQAARFSFKSTSYDWLVVAGARAQYKGRGTVNGAGSYAFILTATDGDVPGGLGGDRFRLKVYDQNQGNAILYDNDLNAPDAAELTTSLGGGSVVVHR